METWYQSGGRRETPPPLGQEMLLDNDTPLGVFECKSGGRFIVCDDFEYGRCAIVLRSDRYSHYSWRKLSHRSKISGRWWGPYRIRLIESYENDGSLSAIGTIYLCERHVGMDCLTGDERRAMTLGMAAEASSDHRNATGWAIDAARAGFTFFERDSDGRFNCAPAPKLEISRWDREDFVEVVSPWT